MPWDLFNSEVGSSYDDIVVLHVLTMFEATSTIPSTDATPDSVLFRASCANAYVQIKTICMVLTLMRSICAGA